MNNTFIKLYKKTIQIIVLWKIKMNGWVDEQVDVCMNEWLYGWMDGWIDGWLKGCMHTWINRFMYKLMEREID